MPPHPKQKFGVQPQYPFKAYPARMPVEFQIEEFMDEEIEEFLRNLRSTDPLRAPLIAELARRYPSPEPTASQALPPVAGAPAQPPRRSARLASACTPAS